MSRNITSEIPTPITAQIGRATSQKVTYPL